MRPKFLALFISLLIGTVALGGLSAAKGRYNKSAFEDVMEASNRNIRVLLGSLIAEDWKKAVSSAETIAEDAARIAKLTPEHRSDRIEEFVEHADSLAIRATRLLETAKEHDHERSSVYLGQIVATCTDCHAIFRK